MDDNKQDIQGKPESEGNINPVSVEIKQEEVITNNLTKDENRPASKKKKIIGITSIIILILCIGMGAAYYFNLPANQLKRALLAKDYSKAEEIYKQAQTSYNEKTQNSFKNMLLNQVTKTENDYFGGKLKGEDALSYLNELAWYPDIVSDARESQSKIKTDIDSNDAVKNATDALNQGNYLLALEDLDKATTKSVQTKVQGLKTKILPLYKEKELKESEDLFNKGDVANAVAQTQTALKYLPNEQAIKDKLVQYQKEKAKRDEEDRLARENRKNELVAQTSRFVDQVTNSVMIVPKGYGQLLDIPQNGVLFYPYLRGEIGNDVFKLIAGFNRSDWVFMKTINANADGTMFSINFSYFDRKSDVGFGSGVYEWVEIPVIEISAIKDSNPNLLENLWKLAHAQNPIIQFKGDTKSFDYHLTDKQKQDLSNFIELHSYKDGAYNPLTKT